MTRYLFACLGMLLLTPSAASCRRAEKRHAGGKPGAPPIEPARSAATAKVQYLEVEAADGSITELWQAPGQVTVLGDRTSGLSGYYRYRGEPRLTWDVVDQLASVKAFRQLRSLYLHRTEISDEGIRHLEGLPHLRLVSAARTGVTNLGVFPLTQHGELRVLGLSGREITDSGAGDLARLKHLRTLHLDDTAMEGFSLGRLGTLTELRVLSLVGAQVYFFDVDRLVRLRHLRRLDLDRTGINDAALELLTELKDLRELSLRHTSVSDFGIGKLHPLKRLRKLMVSGTLVTDEGARAFRQEAPGCQVLR
jgi:Leucine-rich repeat (LRR) protein